MPKKMSEIETEEFIKAMQPLYMELLPLTLEEIFITETEVVGYDFKQLYL